MESVLIVIGLHGEDVRVDNIRRFVIQTDRIDLFFAEFMQIVEIGKAGQRIRVEPVFPAYLVGFYLLPHHFLHCRQVGVGDHGKLSTVRHDLPLAGAMDQHILRLSGFIIRDGFRRINPQPEQDIVRSLMMYEFFTGL